MIVTVPTAELATRLADSRAEAEIVVWALDAPAPSRTIDLVVLPYMRSLDMLGALRGLDVGLLQSQSIGYDGVEQALAPGMVFANAKSVHEASTSELAVALALSAQRGLVQYAKNQDAGVWDPKPGASLADRRVLIVGWGGVAEATAARLAPFETSITRVATRARTLPDGTPVHGADELPELLAHAEIVIVTVPLTSATARMVDDRFLSAMPDGALLVNVARGAVVDTDALVDHVGRGRIRAALDVTDPEPLPADHPLWTLPGVVITPHVGGASSAMLPRMVRLIERQIAHLAANEAPENIVLRT